MTTWIDINIALPAVSGIYWAEANATPGMTILMHYDRRNGAWCCIDSINEGGSKLSLHAVFAPSKWAPIQTPDNSQKETKPQIEIIKSFLEKASIRDLKTMLEYIQGLGSSA